MKIPQVKYVAFRSKRNFGIELEVNQKVAPQELVRVVSTADPDRPVIQSNHYEQDYDNEYWHVKFDRSCGDIRDQGGWEVASYKAKGYKDVENMGRVADALMKAGAKVNDECGFHIHAEIADFKPNDAAIMAAYWMKIEPVVLEMLPKHRKNNKYAKPMSKKFEGDPSKTYTWDRFWEMVSPKRFDHPNRRVALNLCNYCQMTPNRRTVELRLPEGTVDSKEIKNWIRFFVNFIDVVKKKEFPGSVESVNLYDMMNIVGLHNEDPFYILSKGLRDTKMWVANRIIKFSAKRKLKEEAEKFLNALKIEAPKIDPKTVKKELPMAEPLPKVKMKNIETWWKAQSDQDLYRSYWKAKGETSNPYDF
jgi:hypothetical protein